LYDASRGDSLTSKLGAITRSARPTFHTQRDSYSTVLKGAGDHWKEIRDKYRTEKFMKLPLSEKKVNVRSI